MRTVSLIGSSGTLMAHRFGPVALPLAREKKGFDDDEPDDHALGRSRGGFGTKLHLLVDGCGIPLAAAVTAGQTHESTAFETVISKSPFTITQWHSPSVAATLSSAGTIQPRA